MNTRSVNFDAAAGYAATVGHYLGRDTEDRDHFVEFSYWGLNNWLESRTVNGQRLTFTETIDDPQNPGETIQVPLFQGGSLFTEFDSTIGGFNRADEHFMSHQSDINNFELNVRLRPRGRRDRLVLRNGRWRKECQPGGYMSYLFGLRYLAIDEAFGFHGRGVIQDLDQDGDPVGLPGDVSGDYMVLSHNDLLGLQFGGDYICRNCKWTWGFRGKVGPFINFSDQKTRVVTSATADPFATNQLDLRRIARKDDVSLVAEFGFVCAYKLRPNLSIRGSYDLMWVTGLVLAPEQVRFETNPPAELNDNGLIYYHGLSLGMELTW